MREPLKILNKNWQIMCFIYFTYLFISTYIRIIDLLFPLIALSREGIQIWDLLWKLDALRPWIWKLHFEWLFYMSDGIFLCLLSTELNESSKNLNSEFWNWTSAFNIRWGSNNPTSGAWLNVLNDYDLKSVA